MQMTNKEFVSYLNNRIRELDKQAIMLYGDDVGNMTEAAILIQAGISEDVFSIETENALYSFKSDAIDKIEVEDRDDGGYAIMSIALKNSQVLSIAF